MRKHIPKRSSLFLLELIIAILFFSLASAVCIQLFANAHVKSRETADLNMALAKAQSAAEGIRSSEDSESALSLLFPDGKWADKRMDVYYDEDWNACKKELAFYHMSVVIRLDGQMEQSEICLVTLDSDTVIYELTVKKHLANTFSPD